MKLVAAKAAASQKAAPRAAKAPSPRRELRFDAAVPNHVRAGDYDADDPAAAVEIGRAAPRIALPYPLALRALFGPTARLHRLEIHHGNAARVACEILGAKAFTVKNVIVFGEAHPAMSRVVHEVAHALQQGGDRDAAPTRFVAGSLRLGAPGGAAEWEAGEYAAARPVELSPAPLAIYFDTGYEIADTERRLKKMMKTGEWKVTDWGSDHAKARFATKSDTNDKRLIFKQSSPKPFRRGDLHRAALVDDANATIDQASRDVENIFKDNPKATDSIAQQGVEVDGVKYRVSKVRTREAQTVFSLYVFLGDTYTPTAKYQPFVIDRLRGEVEEVDPEVKLADYSVILGNIVTRAKALKKDTKLVKAVQDVIDTIASTLDEGLDTSVLSERLSTIRESMVQAIIKLYPDLDELHDNIIESAVFGKYTSLQGRVFETWYHDKFKKTYSLVEQPVFGEKLGEKVVKSDELHKLRRGDFAMKIKGKYYIKELKALSEPREPGEEEQLQMQDYRTIFDKKIPGYFLVDGKLEERQFKGVEYEFSLQKRITAAEMWRKFLDRYLTTRWYKSVPDPKAKKLVKSKVKGRKSPTITFTIENSDDLVKDFDQSELEKLATKLPGLKLKSAHIELLYERDPRIKTGKFVMDMDMAGQVSKKDDTKPIEPIPEVSADAASGEKDKPPKTPVKETAPDGYFPIKIEKAESTLNKIWKRLHTDVDITDDGLVGTLSLDPGDSGIPGFLTTEGTKISATLAKDRFALEGRVGLKHQTKDITGDVNIKWDTRSRSLSVKGTATAKKVIPIVDLVTLELTYLSAPEEKWDIKVKKIDASKQFGPIKLNVTADEVGYDQAAHAFNADNVTLKATMPALGEVSASAKIEKNEVTRAAFTYESTEFVYPKKSKVIKGAVDGELTYASTEGWGGQLTGKAKLSHPTLKKLGNKLQELELGISLGYKDQKFSGSIGTKTPFDVGKHFRLSEIKGSIDEDGEVSADFTVELINLKLNKLEAKEATLSCTISEEGFKVKSGSILLAFGDPKTDRVSGSVYFRAKGNDLFAGATVDILLRKGMLAHGAMTYDFTKQQANAELSLKSPDNPEGKIQLLSFKPNEPKTLFEIKPKQFVIFMIYVGGMYIEFGFKLDFNYSLDFWVKPTIRIAGIDFGTMSFETIHAEMWMGGDLTAILAAVPRAAIGLFLGHPKLLRGGGGLSFKIQAKAVLSPSGKFDVYYVKKGDEYEASGNAKLGLAMAFGITADLIPDAEFVVLDGVYRKKWEGDSLASFELLKPRDLFTFQVNFGKSLEEEKAPKLPSGSAEPPTSDAKETKRSEIAKGEAKAADAPTADAGAPEMKPGAKGSGDEQGFSFSKMLKDLLNAPKLAPIKAIIDAASEIYQFVSEAIGALVRIIKNWIGGVVEGVRDFLKGVAKERSLFKYLKIWLRPKVGENLFHIVEPLLDMLAKKEAKFVTLISRPIPGLTDLAGWLEWTFDSIMLVLDLSFGSIVDFVSAIKEMIGNFGDVVGYLLNELVQHGDIGVRTNIRGAPLTDALNYPSPDEWKIYIGGYGAHVDLFKSGVPLYTLLSVGPWAKHVQYTRESPHWDYWVETKAKPDGGVAPDAADAVFRAARSSYGLPLPGELAARYGSSLGADLSTVRLHMDGAAARAAEAVNARAYTVGRDIFFGAGEYDPGSPDGEELLAHEVTHAAKQIPRPSPVAGKPPSLALRAPTAATERHADAAARAMVARSQDAAPPFVAPNERDRWKKAGGTSSTGRPPSAARGTWTGLAGGR
ncbi:eCIS core domain-containing protein [Sorangium sp. So ce1097]|uniref:eCIS core domain-containing protein n=1 Tax=Sorangium sp. So ce1097 TaxID=3133330 RepID=UPI003F5EF6C7